MSKTKSIKLNPESIIAIRKNLDTTIIKYWKIIRAENVIAKKALAAGLGSNYDLAALYNEITQLAQKRIMIKGMLASLNMGILKFDDATFKKSNNYAIFAACEAKEAIAQLKMIPTLNPATKSKKGLKNMAKKETFTSAKIASLINKQQLIANKYDAALEKFNSKSTIELSEELNESFKSYLAA